MDKFADLFQKAAAVLGLQIERLWPKIVFVYWLETLLTVIIVPLTAIVMTVVAWKLAWAANHQGNSYDGKVFVLGVAAIFASVIGGVLILVALLGGASTLAALIEPEAAYVRHLTGK